MSTMPVVGRKIDGEKLKRLREDRYLSRQEVADRSGVHRDHIGRIERLEWSGESHLPTIRKLADALDVDPSALVED